MTPEAVADVVMGLVAVWSVGLLGATWVWIRRGERFRLAVRKSREYELWALRYFLAGDERRARWCSRQADEIFEEAVRRYCRR